MKPFDYGPMLKNYWQGIFKLVGLYSEFDSVIFIFTISQSLENVQMDSFAHF